MRGCRGCTLSGCLGIVCLTHVVRRHSLSFLCRLVCRTSSADRVIELDGICGLRRNRFSRFPMKFRFLPSPIAFRASSFTPLSSYLRRPDGKDRLYVGEGEVSNALSAHRVRRLILSRSRIRLRPQCIVADDKKTKFVCVS